MSKIKIVTMKGTSAGEMEIPEILLETKRGAQAVVDSVVAHRSAVRAGTASTLRKGEVAGSNKKPWRQKGTGRARAGVRQSPVWRGGGVAFGPHPREYDKKVNRQVMRLALRRVMGDLVKSGALTVVDAISLENAKTKALLEVVKAMALGNKALFVLDQVDAKIRMAARNLPGIDVVTASGVDVYTLMSFPKVVINKAGLEVLEKRIVASQGRKA